MNRVLLLRSFTHLNYLHGTVSPPTYPVGCCSKRHCKCKLPVYCYRSRCHNGESGMIRFCICRDDFLAGADRVDQLFFNAMLFR